MSKAKVRKRPSIPYGYNRKVVGREGEEDRSQQGEGSLTSHRAPGLP